LEKKQTHTIKSSNPIGLKKLSAGLHTNPFLLNIEKSDTFLGFPFLGFPLKFSQTSQFSVYFSFLYISKFWRNLTPITEKSKISQIYTHKKNFSQFLCQKMVEFCHKKNTV